MPQKFETRSTHLSSRQAFIETVPLRDEKAGVDESSDQEEDPENNEKQVEIAQPLLAWLFFRCLRTLRTAWRREDWPRWRDPFPSRCCGALGGHRWALAGGHRRAFGEIAIS